MALSTFRDSIKSISPPWLADALSELITWSTGAILDALAEQIRQGVKARMPGIGTPTALTSIGGDRLIDRGPRETDTSYASRLRRAFDSWRIAGSPYELLPQLRAYFLPSPPKIRVVSNASIWHEINPTTELVTQTQPSPANWVWDAYAPSLSPSAPRWWRAWVIIDSSAGPWTQWLLGDPSVALGDGHTLGSTATVEEVASIRRILRKWKPANVHIMNTIITFTSTLFEASDAPGAPMPSGDYDVYANRSRDAAYWEGASTQ